MGRTSTNPERLDCKQEKNVAMQNAARLESGFQIDGYSRVQEGEEENIILSKRAHRNPSRVLARGANRQSP